MSAPLFTAIFKLNIKINGKVREYNCWSNRYFIDEIKLLAWLSERINKEPPLELSILVEESKLYNTDIYIYFITIERNGRHHAMMIDDLFKVEKEMYGLLESCI